MNKSFTIQGINKEETNFLKGIAILLIAFHNYFRWITPITGENEFSFSSLNAIRSIIFVRSYPLEFFHVFFNFLGHYGVQAFIVISAYGLTLSYRNTQPRYGKFILHRIDKLYPSFLLAAVFFFVFQIIFTGSLITFQTLGDLGIQLSLFSNFIPGKALALCGPWWFYSFIFQFYLAFPLIIWFYSKAGTKALLGLMIIGYLFSWLMYSPMITIGLNPLTMFLGHMPEFCFGILLAVKKEIRIPFWVLIIAFLLFLGGNYFPFLWPFANLGVSVLLIVGILALSKVKEKIKFIYKLVSFIGVISMYIFACHGFLRTPFLNLANTLNSSISSFIIGLIFITFATGVAFLIMILEKQIRESLNENRSRKLKYGKFLILTGSIFVGFGFLLNNANKISVSANQPKKEVTAYSVSNNFENSDNTQNGQYSETIFYHGKRSFKMSPPQTFSPDLQIDLGKVGNLDGIYEAEASTMLFTTDSLSSGNLVFEIYDLSSGKRIEWQSTYLDKGKFTLGKWFPCEFRYPLSKAYLSSDFKVKTYLWTTGKGVYYADDLKLELKARR